MNKRIIALILAVATVLGCTAFAWEEASPKTEADFAKELLYELDIIDVVTKDGYAPEQVLTRAQLADAILGLNGYRDSASYGSCFADVNEATDHADAIATLLSNGIIAQAVNYNPEANAKFEQAVKMIVYSLGFGTVTEAQGGWLQPIMEAARSSGVTKGVNVIQGTDLTADMLASLLFNSLDSEMLKRKSLNEFETIKGETLLLKKHGIKKVKGIVTANAITSLTSAQPAAERVSIDWHEYRDADQKLSGYLGMEAVAYYTEDDEEIVFGYPTDRNYVKTISADDILPNASGFDYENICYREVKESGVTRSTKAKVAADADVIYNGKAYPEYEVNDFKISTGRLVLIDNDNDKIAEVVMIEESVNYVVESVNIADVTIYDMYGATLDLEDVEFLEITDMYGSRVDISGLAKWNVISVVMSNDGEYAKIAVYNDPVVGEVEAYWTEDDETYATIDGDTFKVSQSYLDAVASGNTNAKKLVVGQNGTFYLDGEEKIAAVNLDVDSSWQYAFLIKAQMTDDWGVRYRLMMDESGFKWYDGAESVRIDEVKKEDEERKTALDDDNVIEANRKTVPQMVKVQMNGNGQIKKIDTIAQGAKENEDNLTRAITTYDTFADGSTDTSRMHEIWSIRTGRFGIGSSVGVYVHPSAAFIVWGPKTGDIYDESNYRIHKGNFSNNAHLSYNAYDVDWAGIAGAAMIYHDGHDTSSGGVSGTLLFVHSISSVLNDDDEIIREVRGLDYTGAEVTLPMEIDLVTDVDKGDVIRYNTNIKNEIDEINTVFDYSAQKNFDLVTNFEYSSGDTDGSYRGNSSNYINGNVIIDRQGGYIKTLAEGEEFASITNDMPYTKTQIFSLADATIMLYDSVAPANERYTRISSSELNKYIYDRNVDARVILYTTYSQLRTVIVYI